MDLLCYVPTGWTFKIRPAEAKRDWMDRTADAFAYRCLPLNIANAHGWEVLSPSSFEAIWNGGSNRADLTVRMIGRHDPAYAPVSLFGNGVLTIHMHGLFRTPPGWNLWVSGPPNRPKDGVYPLTGIVETDWSPYTFTMNWQVTRPNHWIRFDEGEPVCFFFPVRRGLLDTVEPRLVALEKNQDLLRQFNDWRESRDRFYKNLPVGGSAGDTWQKLYYQGVDMHGRCPVSDHETKLRLKPFAPGDAPPRLEAPAAAPAEGMEAAVPAASRRPSRTDSPASATVPASAPSAAPTASGVAADPAAIRHALQLIGVELMSGADPAPLVARIVALGAPEAEARRIIETANSDPLIIHGREMAHALHGRDWLLSGIERQRRLAPSAERIDRRDDLGSDEFLERYYAQHRPVVLLGEISDWPALAEWTPEYLSGKVGSRVIDVGDADAEDARRDAAGGGRSGEMPFDAFIDRALRSSAGSAGEVAFSSTASQRNGDILGLLRGDLGFVAKLMDRSRRQPIGRMSIRPAGALTSLRQERANQLIAQIVGRTRLKIVPAGDTPLIHAAGGGERRVSAAAPDVDWAKVLASGAIKVYDVTLGPAEILFVPFGWWYQAKSLDFAVTITCTDFKWPNESSPSHPNV